MVGSDLLKRFLAKNRSICERLERYLPQARPDLFELYIGSVLERLNSRPCQIVLDVGGGKTCPLSGLISGKMNSKIVAVDISHNELRENCDVDGKVAADLMRTLPFASGTADLVISRSTLEHLIDLEHFIREGYRVLKRGGYFIHLFASKFAPFALANQMLPPSLSRRLLHSLFPGSEGICGFPAVYNQCYYSATKRLLVKHGFDPVDIRLSYYQSRYYQFLVPLFIVSAMYELCVRAIRAKNLCAYLLVVAQKRGGD